MELAVTIGIASILFVVIGFLFNAITNLNKGVYKLGATITGLNATLLAQDDKISSQSIQCAGHRNTINDRLKDHGVELDRQGKDIIRLQSNTLSSG